MELQPWFLVDSFRSRCQERDSSGMLGWVMLSKHQLCWQPRHPSCCAVHPLCVWGCGLGSCLMSPNLQVRRHVQSHTETYPRASSHTQVSSSTLAQFDPGVSALVQHLPCPVCVCVLVHATLSYPWHTRGGKAVLLLKLQMNAETHIFICRCMHIMDKGF